MEHRETLGRTSPTPSPRRAVGGGSGAPARLALLARLALPALLAIPTLLGGCGQPPVDGVMTAQLAGQGSVRDHELVVPRGRVLAFVAQPLGGDEPLPVAMRLESEDLAVADVKPLEAMNQFVLIGVGPGRTTLRMFEPGGQLATPALEAEVQ